VDGRLQIFAGTSHPELATEIMRELEAPLGRATVGLWRNGETRVKLEENVRGCDVFAIQSMSAPVDRSKRKRRLDASQSPPNWSPIFSL
jgi:ribose-phosphate pyrophosphokinase